jgi:hypothetical protein
MSTTQTNNSLWYFYHYRRREIACYLPDIFQGGVMEQEYKQLLVRFRVETKDLLDAAARDQRRSRTSIIEELVIESLKPRYSSTENRLNKLLGAG